MPDAESKSPLIDRVRLHTILDQFLDAAAKQGLAVVPLLPLYRNTRIERVKSGKRKGEVTAQVLAPEVWFGPEALAPEYRACAERMQSAFGGVIVLTMMKPDALIRTADAPDTAAPTTGSN